MPDDRRNPSLGEQMNSYLYLDPGFAPDREGGLVGALRDEIDDTVERAKNAPKPHAPDEATEAEPEG